MYEKKILFAISALGLIFGLTFGLGPGPVAAGDHNGEEHEKNERYEKHEHRGRELRTAAQQAQNPLYKQECSSCHFLYLPGLLTERSWKAVINGSKDHFGEDLALDDPTKRALIAYLSANSAERTDTEWAKKINAASAGSTPERITQIPWIMREHRKIGKDVFKRPSIKSASNCVACHSRADKGDFDEDNVTIPAK